MESIKTKFCKYCEKSKPEGEFEIANIVKGKTYRRKKCSVCKQSRQRERIGELREWLKQYKSQTPCHDCGIMDFRVIDFHHLNPAEKEKEVSNTLMRGGSVKRIKAEIAKCIPLCANCHRIKHYDDLPPG